MSKQFKWNEKRNNSREFWSGYEGCQFEPYSDKDLLQYPTYYDYREVVTSICRILLELMEFEENRK